MRAVSDRSKPEKLAVQNAVPDSIRPPDILPFWGTTTGTCQLWLEHDGHNYYVRYRGGWISVERDEEEVFAKQIGTQYACSWSDEETTVYLGLISDAIRHGVIETLDVPEANQAGEHQWYRKGPLPLVEAGLVCGAETPPGILLDVFGDSQKTAARRHAGIHYHSNECIKVVPACELDNWIGEHPDEHRKLNKWRKRLRRDEFWWGWNRASFGGRVMLPLLYCLAGICDVGVAVEDWVLRKRRKVNAPR